MISPQIPSSQPATQLTMVAQARVPTDYGTFTMKLFLEESTGREHVAMVMGEVSGTAGASFLSPALSFDAIDLVAVGAAYDDAAECVYHDEAVFGGVTASSFRFGTTS